VFHNFVYFPAVKDFFTILSVAFKISLLTVTEGAMGPVGGLSHRFKFCLFISFYSLFIKLKLK